jgi:hypothetical protein
MAGDSWSFPEYGWPVLRVHPVHLLDADDLAVVELWRAWRGEGGGIGGALPFAGGAGDQPAALMAAFQAMEALAWELRPKK